MDVILSRDGVDALECDLLVSGLFQDERPIKGTSGWIDWRLNGRISRLVMDKRLTGDWKETTLIPSRGRIAPRMILLVGLGRTREYSSIRLRDLFAHVLETVRNLRASSICLSLPFGEGGYGIDSGKLTELFLEAVGDGLNEWKQSADREWVEAFRLFFAEGENRFSEIVLGVRAAQAVLRDRLPIRLLIPSEESVQAT
jgi:hypothetical protein